MKQVEQSKKTVEDLLALADVKVGGNRPQDIKVVNEEAYSRILGEGSLGLGEAYMDGWWEANVLDEFFFHILKARLHEKVSVNWRTIIELVPYVISNAQRQSRAFVVGEKHYDIGNDLYEKMLDKNMVYSCGYWKDATTLDDAQEAKLDLACRKVGLKPGMKVLDIGCGWGSFAKFAAERYGVTVVGITVSKEQASLGKERCKGLPVEIRLQDYRELNEQFDRIISIGMFEHVGAKNYGTYMDVVHRCLKEDGLFLLHTIGSSVSRRATDPWIGKYIFPGGMLPSAKQIAAATEGLFIMEDWHNFGAYYDKTLMAWFQNFNASWPGLKDTYGERFYRMWKYYLLSCAGSFRARNIQLWQVVFSKHGVPGGYTSVR